MIDLHQETLPIRSELYEFELSSESVLEFKKVSRQEAGGIPPCIYAKSLKGLFALFEKLQVDFQKLLHISQSFEYLGEVSVGDQLHSRTSLVKFRERAGALWLDFEAEITKKNENKASVIAKSRIMIGDSKLGA